MRASQFRGALLRARRHLSLAVNACALGLVLSACGGNDTANTNASGLNDLPVTVSGADGASVSLRPLERKAAKQVTVRVARDGSGAPLLGQRYMPLGAVYQFTPLGWVEEAVEIRVPFAAAESDAPRLLIAQPGGEWMEVAGAHREGGFMVARVARLSYATVATAAAGSRASARSTTLNARIRSLVGDEPAPPLALAFGAETAPALPAPVNGGLVTVRTETSLSLDLHYELPACSVPAFVEVIGVTWQPDLQNLKYVNLGQRAVAGSTGTEVYRLPLSASDNGNWMFLANSFCKEPGKSEASFSFAAFGAEFNVDINSATPTPAPTITSAPNDAAVVDGAQASFSVVAQGDELTYEWQRSNNGGASYTPVGASNAPSYGFAASLSDHNALVRVRVSNANGSTTSTPAWLTVTARVSAPVVTSDPAHQSVLEGETASFSVAGVGQPAPTAQWQQRIAANADAEAGWADIAGATGNTYTTTATTIAQSGAQYRALLRNAGGTAASLPANLVVNARVIAPAIVTAPQSLSVTAGQFGALAVTASGTSPLSYQWFKNGVAIAGANASEVLVFADPADAGSSYQITVQVTNGVGTAVSPPATLSVLRAGSVIDPAVGGSVEITDVVTLSIPPGALAASANVSVWSERVDPSDLPVDFSAVGDIVNIEPAGLQFLTPVQLTVVAPEEVPLGMAVAVVRVDNTSIRQSLALSAHSGQAQPAVPPTLNLGRAARLGKPVALGRVGIQAITVPSNIVCSNLQNIGADRKLSKFVQRAGSYVQMLVPEAACGSTEPQTPPDGLPRDTYQACDSDADFVTVTGSSGVNDSERTLVNRHVDCRASVSDAFDVYRYDANGSGVPVGRARLETRLATFGASTQLAKTYRVRVRLTEFTPHSGHQGALPSIKVRPNFECVSSANRSTSHSCSHTAPEFNLSLSSVGSWSSNQDFTVSYSWTSAPDAFNDYEEFSLYFASLEYALASDNWSRFRPPLFNVIPNTAANMGSPAILRCDRGVAQASTNGCVFREAVSVYVLSRSDPSVQEAAQHILEAQNGPLQSPGRFLLRPGTRAMADQSVTSGAALQRAKAEAVRIENRNQSCTLATSLFRTRLPLNQSANCAAGTHRCSCDEYPFASTWSGGRFNPAHTSAKSINFDHNHNAGSGRLTSFYRTERVLDFTQYPEQVQPYDPSAESNRGGDDFWVHVK